MFNKMAKVSVIPAALGLVTLTATNGLCALSADQQAAADTISTMVTDLAAWAWPVLIAIISFTIGAKLFKKFMGKAT